MTIEDARGLFLQQLRTMLWVELKLADDVLPELYDGVHATDLKLALERHRRETEDHARNLRRVFALLHADEAPEESAALLGLVADHDRLPKLVAPDRPDLSDLLHLEAIARTEHLEIAAYEWLVQAAQALGLDEEAVLLLRENVGQELYALEEAEHSLAKLLAEEVETPRLP